MPSIPWRPLSSRPVRRAASTALGFAAIVALGLLGTTSLSQAALGKWSPPQTWSQIAVHMALLPGDGSPYHSRVIWWVDEDAKAFRGGLWGWKDTLDTSVDCSTYPSAKFVDLGLDSPSVNMFCAGLTHLADGRLLVVGGTEVGTENGLRSTSLFSPGSGTGTGSWASPPPDSMFGRRWYATATVLNDGRVLASSGSEYDHIEYFGGLADGDSVAADSTLARYAVIGNDFWDGPATQSSTWPGPLYGHTAAPMGNYGTTVYFGGRTANDTLSRTVWFQYRSDPNQAKRSSDYEYTWNHPSIITDAIHPSPYPRMFHSAIVQDDSVMIVYGGIEKPNQADEVVTSELWRLRRVLRGTSYKWIWEQLTTNASPPPGARFGHRAVYDAARGRMVMFGGAADISNPIPDDTTVWALSLPDTSSTSATWSQLPVINPAVHPSARYDHSMGYVQDAKSYSYRGATYANVQSAILFGGRTSDGTRSNDLWRLVFAGADSVRWIPITTGSARPAPRSAHTGTLDPGVQRLYVFGGLTDSGAASDTTWMADLGGLDTTATWYAHALIGGVSMAWHTAHLTNPIFNRLPEIFDPAATSTQWSHATTGARYLLQEWYPQMFLAPNGLVFNSGPSDSSYYFDPVGRTWRAYPATGQPDHTISGFRGGSAAMYRPGKVLKVGTRDTEVGVTAVKTSKTIDLTGTDSTWHASGDMAYGRVNMNLTLLPTGQVLVTGGTGKQDNFNNIDPVFQPEIWDPAANSEAGAWSGGSGTDRLDTSTVIRGYHSVALLLPDGRILCAGGNNNGDPTDPHLTDPEKADLFCPPYLFQDADPNALATRPTHSSPPAGHMKWGRVFTIATDRASTIRSVCLIKPGAVTHAFNQDQRYVPLSFVAETNPSRLLVTAPADSNIAPPGDYLLFMLDSTATARRVPSIATWMKMDRYFGRDSADASAPGIPSSVAFDLSTTSIILEWTAPADDSLIAASGPVLTYDIRRSTAAIADSAWDTSPSTPVAFAHAAYGPGSTDWALAGGLSACTTYHFRLRAKDDNLAFGARTVDTTATTMGCSGGGGGGMGGSAQRAGGGAAVSSSGRAGAGTAATSTQTSGGVVLVTTSRSRDGSWRICARSTTSTAGLGLPDTTGMFIQMPDGLGGYQPARHLVPAAGDDEIGLCALLDGRRVVLAGGYALQAVAPSLHAATGGFALASAVQGTAGDLGANFVATGGAVSLAAEDSLVLTYQPSTNAPLSPGAWYASSVRTASTTLAARPQRPAAGSLPVRFALHQNQPNPFGSATTIRFDLPVGVNVRLDVFDAQGRRVRTLADRFFPAGYQSVTWDPARGDAGRLGPGVYFYRIEAGPFRERRKMVLTGR